jgi:SAM-dependent methyltransferase
MKFDDLAAAACSFMARPIRRLRWALRRIRRRTLSVDDLWHEDVPAEVEFWRRYLLTRGSDWPDEYQHRVDPTAALSEPLVADRLGRFAGPAVSILDVGAGPLTILGKRHPDRELDITAVDPLAEHYDRILAEAQVSPIVRTIPCAGEALVDRFGEAAFDIVYARNAIDHTVHPVDIIHNMVAVVRPGGFVALRHYRQEAVSTGWAQLHQWNFDVGGGELLIWGRQVMHNITQLLADQATTNCWIDPSSDKTPWVLAVIDKH